MRTPESKRPPTSRMREAFTRYCSGMNFTDIAAEMGITRGRATSLCHSAARRLGGKLIPGGFEKVTYWPKPGDKPSRLMRQGPIRL